MVKWTSMQILTKADSGKSSPTKLNGLLKCGPYWPRRLYKLVGLDDVQKMRELSIAATIDWWLANLVRYRNNTCEILKKTWKPMRGMEEVATRFTRKPSQIIVMLYKRNNDKLITNTDRASFFCLFISTHEKKNMDLFCRLAICSIIRRLNFVVFGTSGDKLCFVTFGNQHDKLRSSCL